MAPSTETPTPKPSAFPAVQGRCPACGHTGLFLGSGGYVTCAWIECPDPCAATDLLERDLRAAADPKWTNQVIKASALEGARIPA